MGEILVFSLDLSLFLNDGLVDISDPHQGLVFRSFNNRKRGRTQRHEFLQNLSHQLRLLTKIEGCEIQVWIIGNQLDYRKSASILTHISQFVVPKRVRERRDTHATKI